MSLQTSLALENYLKCITISIRAAHITISYYIYRKNNEVWCVPHFLDQLFTICAGEDILLEHDKI